MSERRLAVLIVFAAVAVYLIGNGSVSLWDRDEPRYAQTSRQMLRSGDWIVPRLLDEPREKKPVFIYWCQATSMALLGETAFAARLPSVVFVCFTLIVLIGVLWQKVEPKRAAWTTFIFGTSALTIAAAKMAITDGVLVFFTTISQLGLYALWQGRATWSLAVNTGVAVGLGMLTKGPVVPGVMVMTLAALSAMRWIDRKNAAAAGKIPWGKWLVVIVVAFAVLGPWLWAIEQRLPGYTLRTIRAEVLDRAAKPQEGHKGPVGYYLLTVWGTFLPWSWLLPAAIVGAWRNRSEPQIRFALAAVVGPWAMLEIIQTKLPHYLLPTFPALAFLSADALIRRGRSLKAPAVAGIVMLVLVAAGYGLILPHVSALRISQNVADTLIRHGATNPGDAIMIGYREMSLAFYQGGTIRPERDDTFLVKTPPEQWPRWIVLSEQVWSDTPEQIRNRLEVVTSVRGLNYSDRMKIMKVLVLRKR